MANLQKLRPALVYLNARRYGMIKSEAHQCAITWQQIFNTCFSQSVADEVYSNSHVETVNFPRKLGQGVLYVTAHFSAYSIVSAALAKHFQKTIYVVVGKPPADFEVNLQKVASNLAVKLVVIRSDFSLLRNIRRAIDEGSLVLSLIDVPWHRISIPGRDYEYFDLGEGKIKASKAIFNLASRLSLTPHFVLCEPENEGFKIVNYGATSQGECFAKLSKAIELNPGHFERFCELHAYYVGRPIVNEIVTFTIGQYRYCISPGRNKYWKLSESVSAQIESELLEEQSGEAKASSSIRREIRKMTDWEYDDIVYI
jgi:hypothetical protein